MNSSMTSRSLAIVFGSIWRRQSTRVGLALTLVGAGPFLQPAQAQSGSGGPWWLELEVQRLRIVNNQVQLPNDSQGTRFDATDFTGDTANSLRLTAFVPLGWWQPRDALRVVIAPLVLSGTAVPAAPIGFDGATFLAGAPLTVDYKFNTYRFTYVVPIFTESLPPDWDLRAGFTLAVRDARIQLSQGTLVRDYPNAGPIPLLYMSATKAWAHGWRTHGEFDAFPAPGGGGLFDGSLKLGLDVMPGVELNAGVRYQIGAAKDPEIYNSLSTWAFVLGLRGSF